MARRTKVTISIDPRSLHDLDEISGQSGISRSRLIEDAIRLLRRRILEEQLRHGYAAMEAEDREAADAALDAMAETLK
jgi:metal-responsive CopG/Arc/MetJ family transcriptional regulator